MNPEPQFNPLEPPTKYPTRRMMRNAARTSLIFFLISALVTPNKPMGGFAFFCTWGMTMLSALISFLGYLACRMRSEAVSFFYLLCPVVIFACFILLLFQHEVAHIFH